MTFEDFVRAELVALTRFAGAVTGDRALAEDVLSDALLKVSRQWGRLSGMDDPARYVRRVITTTYLSDRRRAGRRRTVPVGDLSVLGGSVPDPSAEVITRDEVEHLLALLPPQQKVAVVLRYLLDETDDHIAEVLGCTPATVRSHLSHARAALRLSATATATKE